MAFGVHWLYPRIVGCGLAGILIFFGTNERAARLTRLTVPEVFFSPILVHLLLSWLLRYFNVVFSKCPLKLFRHQQTCMECDFDLNLLKVNDCPRDQVICVKLSEAPSNC